MRRLPGGARASPPDGRQPSAAITPIFLPSWASTASRTTSIILTKGIPTAAWMSVVKAWAVLQTITRKSAPAISSPRAIAASSGPTLGVLPAIASCRFGTEGL